MAEAQLSEPHRLHGFKPSRDKHFVEELTDPVELNLNPPDKAVVVCVDNTSHPRLSGVKRGSTQAIHLDGKC